MRTTRKMKHARVKCKAVGTVHERLPGIKRLEVIVDRDVRSLSGADTGDLANLAVGMKVAAHLVSH